MSAAKTKAAKKPKPARPTVLRAFRFNAAQTVQVRFAGEKKPENFRIDDMVDATTATLSGQTGYGF